MSWLYMSLAIILEIAGTTCLKLSDGLSNLVPSIFVVVFYVTCFSFFAAALKKLNLSLAYAVWSGVGTVGITFIGLLWFHEQLTWAKIVGLTFVAIGLVTLNFTKVAEERS
ncbi:MAG: multidrug efflux SMR transporter [Okeania sp. SIO3B5]|nr:multidrug efflux SMR transporter [Okeania sp. SIO3B5]